MKLWKEVIGQKHSEKYCSKWKFTSQNSTKKSGGFQFHVQELRENRPMHCSQMKINRFSPVEAFPVFQSDFENKRRYRRSKVTPLLGKITGIWNKCRRGKCKTYLLFPSLFSFCTFLFHSHSQTHTLVCTHHSWQQQPHVVMQDNQGDLDF